MATHSFVGRQAALRLVKVALEAEGRAPLSRSHLRVELNLYPCLGNLGAQTPMKARGPGWRGGAATFTLVLSFVTSNPVSSAERPSITDSSPLHEKAAYFQ